MFRQLSDHFQAVKYMKSKFAIIILILYILQSEYDQIVAETRSSVIV
jgi:hypothetical protein